jgi:hypothetical protein
VGGFFLALFALNEDDPVAQARPIDRFGGAQEWAMGRIHIVGAASAAMRLSRESPNAAEAAPTCGAELTPLGLSLRSARKAAEQARRYRKCDSPHA